MQHPRYFGEEAGKPKVEDRGGDVDHRVEGLVREW